MYADPRRETKRRSPLVVSKRRIPTRGDPPGFFISQMVMTISMQKIVIKKAAVGLVQAIQLRFMSFSFYPACVVFTVRFEGYMFFHLLVNLLIPLKSAGHKFNHEILSKQQKEFLFH
jgi:hypothetical protein